MSWDEIGLALAIQGGFLAVFLWGLWSSRERKSDQDEGEYNDECDCGTCSPATTIRVRGVNTPDFAPDMFVRLYQAENGVMLELQSSTPQQGAYTRSLTLFTGEDISKIGEVVQTKLAVQRMTGGK